MMLLVSLPETESGGDGLRGSLHASIKLGEAASDTGVSDMGVSWGGIGRRGQTQTQQVWKCASTSFVRAYCVLYVLALTNST